MQHNFGMTLPSNAPRLVQSLLLKFWLPLRATARTELGLFSRHPKLRMAALAIAWVPAIYALIYLSSVWDPNARTGALPVGLVNLDTGVSYRGQQVNVGKELAASLVKKATFAFRPLDTPASATAAVRSGALAFALIIPADFSAKAVPGATPGGGKVQVILSEGNNYSSAGFARRFSAELGHQMNETLNEKRWSLVLSNLDGSGKSLANLRAGVAQLREGSKALDRGAANYAGVADQVAGGFKQVGAGLRTMESKWPADADLQALKAGHAALVPAQRELTNALDQLQVGAQKLTDGNKQMRDQTVNIPLVGAKISKGAGDLATGGAQLVDGLGKAHDASDKLTRGAAQLELSTQRLVDGVSVLGDGVRTLNSKIPDDQRLDAFAAGGHSLSEGAAKLSAGIEMLYAALPASLGGLDGSARGLADSVEPELQVLAPVSNNGSAFAPNMVSVALWIGAVMTAYLFNMRLLLIAHAQAPAWAKSLGKFSAPASVVLLQVVVMSGMVVWGLGVTVAHPLQFVATLVTASLVFLAMVFALLRVFGEAGKLLAVLLLTLQLAAGGGVMPIELSGDFFRAVHDWLPFSWVVRAFRVCLFDALDGNWLLPWSMAVGSGLIALATATWIGRWKMASEVEYLPGLNV